MMNDETKANVERRLKRIAGQVNGIQKMVDDDRYCIDVLNQIAAVRSALSRVGDIVFDQHVESCVVDAVQSGSDSERQEKIDELRAVFRKFKA